MIQVVSISESHDGSLSSLYPKPRIERDERRSIQSRVA